MVMIVRLVTLRTKALGVTVPCSRPIDGAVRSARLQMLTAPTRGMIVYSFFRAELASVPVVRRLLQRKAPSVPATAISASFVPRTIVMLQRLTSITSSVCKFVD